MVSISRRLSARNTPSPSILGIGTKAHARPVSEVLGIQEELYDAKQFRNFEMIAAITPSERGRKEPSQMIGDCTRAPISPARQIFGSSTGIVLLPGLVRTHPLATEDPAGKEGSRVRSRRDGTDHCAQPQNSPGYSLTSSQPVAANLC
jgi:hypothetical protein